MPFRIEFDDKELLRNLPRGAPEAIVFNDKRTRSGLSLFRIIDRGRGPVRPVRAKALRIPLRGGQVIFRKFARATRPQFLREKAVAAMQQAGVLAVSFNLTQDGLVEFINSIARTGLNELRRKTPRRGIGGGKRLADSYRLKEAR